MGTVTQQLEGTKSDEPVVSKKDTSGSFGSNAVGPRTENREHREPREQRDYKDYKSSAPVEERKEATKPVFTSSKKKHLEGGAATEEILNSKQNYDFSSLKVSAATSGQPKTKAEHEAFAEGQHTENRAPRQRREYQEPEERSFGSKKHVVVDFDAEFETVTDKKRNPKPAQFRHSKKDE